MTTPPIPTGTESSFRPTEPDPWSYFLVPVVALTLWTVGLTWDIAYRESPQPSNTATMSFNLERPLAVGDRVRVSGDDWKISSHTWRSPVVFDVDQWEEDQKHSPEYWVGYRVGRNDGAKNYRRRVIELQRGMDEQALGRVKAIGEREVCRARLKDCTCP